MSNSMPPLLVVERAPWLPTDSPRSGIIQKAGHSPGAVGDFDRQKGWRLMSASHPESASPAVYQRAINIVASRHLRYRHPRLQRFRDDPLLQRFRPIPAPVGTAQNLHPMNRHVTILAACIVATQSTTKTARHLISNKTAFLGCVLSSE